MKRTFDTINNDWYSHTVPEIKKMKVWRHVKWRKLEFYVLLSLITVIMGDTDPKPTEVTLVDPLRTAKNSCDDSMEVQENLHLCNMDNLFALSNGVHQETEVNDAVCNFVKKPEMVYHLYQRPSGQKYLGMVSPQEWINAPHKFLGSFRLNTDMSWTPIDQEKVHYQEMMLRDDYFDPNTRNLLTRHIR